MPEENQVAYLLNDLCVKLGFCLPRSVINRLIEFPPKTSTKFAKTVIEAEGFTVESIDKDLYKSVLFEIEKCSVAMNYQAHNQVEKLDGFSAASLPRNRPSQKR